MRWEQLIDQVSSISQRQPQRGQEERRARTAGRSHHQWRDSHYLKWVNIDKVGPALKHWIAEGNEDCWAWWFRNENLIREECKLKSRWIQPWKMCLRRRAI